MITTLTYEGSSYRNADPEWLIAQGVPVEVVEQAQLYQLKASYTVALENHVDAVAAERDYSSAASLASYTASTNSEWAAEAQTFIEWRDAFWAAAIAKLAEVEAGAPAPGFDALIAELPKITWPDEAD